MNRAALKWMKQLLRRLAFCIAIIPVMVAVPILAGVWWLLTGRSGVYELAIDLVEWGLRE